MATLTRFQALVFCTLIAACESKSDDGDSASDTTMDSGGDATGESGETSEDTGDTDDTDATDGSGETGEPSDCGSYTDQASCEAQNTETLSCLWQTAWRASRTGDVCEVEETGVCFGIEIGNTAAGCGSLAGCDDGPYTNPFYVEEEGGTVLLVDFCGGSPPAEYQPCSTGEASADDPPECACACALAP